MDEPLRSTQGDILVIGYGNPLRGDDAIGPMAAEAVAGWGLSGVVALAVHQLTPELAEPLAAARLVLFADARLAGEGEGVEVRPIEPSGAGAVSAHGSDPRLLLALARAAYGTHPRAWLVTVPATNLDTGIGLSSTAARGLDAALGRIAALARDVEIPPGDRSPPATMACRPRDDNAGAPGPAHPPFPRGRSIP